MKPRPRIYYSGTQKALMWDRWRKGDTIHQIASIEAILRFSGYYRRPAASSRCKGPRAAGIDAR